MNLLLNILRPRLKITYNADYESLKEYIISIPDIFESEGEVIYKARNVIKVMSAGGYQINVKRYAKPNIFNRFIYRFLRTPKGRRAFEYPYVLLSRGFETPEPIAYIEQRRFGLMSYSYFISRQSPYKQMFYQFAETPAEEIMDLITAFGQYTARMHKAGILHCDYSPGNILFEKVDGEYHFSLVDTNRMYFGNVDVLTGCVSFIRLWGTKSFFEQLAKVYAKERDADEEYCRETILTYRKKFWTKYLKKHSLPYKPEL